MAAQLTLVHINALWPLGATALAHDETRIHRLDVAFRKFSDRHRGAIQPV